MNLGYQEVILILVVAFVWLAPLAALMWAVVTLQRIRVGQDDLRRRLESIERLLQAPRVG